MGKLTFVDTILCGFVAQCSRCRDSVNSGFREKMSKKCPLPGDDINFDCPYGMKWIGEKPESRIIARTGSTPIPETGDTKKGCGCNKGVSSASDVRFGMASPESMSLVKRVQCPDCTRKHLAQAIINLHESIDGHPELRVLAIGHIAEAEAECKEMYLDIGATLNGLWKGMFAEKGFIPDLMPLILEITRRVEEKAALDAAVAVTPVVEA